MFLYISFLQMCWISQLNTNKSHRALVSEHGRAICNISVFKFV